ncbi:transcription factor HIVEP2 isoform X2 [Dunckerocampus dactyliophorus]|uniref:transcription factor HIVEP2 isoform X2 n=1 Tax=Dunckerocampus dactyliophorus TaxID=161453 RepID=UPI0024070040|nr:transcription factor HIVEP2 isoform X2 [Dunckerocampus dactyliophorus]
MDLKASEVGFLDSLETSTGGQEKDAAPKKCTSEAAKTRRSPSVEMEGTTRDTRGSTLVSNSGKSVKSEDSHAQTEASLAIKSTSRHRAALSFGGGGSALHRKSPSSPEQQSCYSGMEQQQSDTSGKVEPKPQKPGKYVCDYCGRACAKPSVLKKHIRSHTGERPYPCVPCGFSFKTKSNLYKHRKSHAHAVKAGTAPSSEAGSHNVNADQGSFEAEGEFSDVEQSTDTDEDTLNDPLLLLDSPVEGSDHTAVKVLSLVSQKKSSTTSLSAQDSSFRPPEVSAPPAAPEGNRAIQSCTIKQRLALRLSEKRSSDSEHNLSLPSQSSKGSTDSGYFSRSESTEHQTGPPNANAKSYQEIMFGKCYRPSPKQTAAYVAYSADSGDCTARRSEKGVSRVFTQEKDTVESIKINTKSLMREEAKEEQLDNDSDVGPLLRSNSMPASTVVSLAMPQALRGSHSFDERASNAGMRRLRRQAAFELSPHEGHSDTDSKMSEVSVSLAGPEMESHGSAAPSVSQQRHAMELATRKRRKEKREEEDLPGQYEARCEQCEEMFDPGKDYEPKLVGMTKGRPSSTQTDSSDMDVPACRETCARKTLGNVISVIQHTNSINRPHAEQTDSSKCHKQRQESFSCFQPTEEAYEMDRCDSRLSQSFQMGPKLVRQPNIQVPEIRVTVEPDSPEKTPDVPVKEPEKHVEEFQWPQRSETLAQFPPEKLPPKKKRLRLADIEHSSGESSFESACTSLSRSPSQDSNLSYSSTFSFDREESLKAVSPVRQDDFGKPLELLAVPGSGHSLSVLNQRQQHEMRRSSSEQAPCNLRKEFPEVRSVSFDYGCLSPTSKVRSAELLSGHVAAKEKRRGNLVRQESLSMDAEASQVTTQVLPQRLVGTTPVPHTLPIFSTGNTPHPSLSVPVRIQTQVPSYGNLTYTSVSRIFDDRYDRVHPLVSSQNQTSCSPGNPDCHGRSTLSVQALDLSSAKLKTGIPLSLTSRTISTTNASSGGANKRMLSPASSLDLFMEVKQQKRVKEERMFGQIVEELSAVELGKCHLGEEKGHASEMRTACAPRLRDDSRRSEFVMLGQKATDRSGEAPMESSCLDTGSPPPYSALPICENTEVGTVKQVQMDTGAQPFSARDMLISEAERPGPLSPFPSLRTTTGVSWCYLSYAKPSFSHDNAPLSSVYATWCVSARNPNPLELSTGATLALLRSKQKGGKIIYTVAATCQPGNGKLVSSLILWRQTFQQRQRKPEPKEVDVNLGKKKDASFRLKAAKEEWKEREASAAQTAPTRIKIFEGGYKSNEDYVYVRGRGRGKYICEECGIRCKKPSMLKKHIRTHTDVRPYICKVCNFAFKTKGNLTKHMKSKAHMKKCLEVGVSLSTDETEVQEHDDMPHQSKAEVALPAKHQFSDAEDSDGMDEDVDEMDEDEDEDEDYEGDSTPKLRSRSMSPQPCGGTSPPVMADAAIHGSLVTPLPGVDVRHQASGERGALEQTDRSVEEDALSVLSPDQAGFLFDPYPSCLLSPGWESPIREPSPSRLRYPSPRRELSPRGRSSPRWDASPLRPGSPSLSPVQHLSPVAMERQTSPGGELAGKRESAVRGRQRVVLRAVSPRRGSHQHRGVGDKSRQHAKMDIFEMEPDQRSVSTPGLPGCPHQNILSHLPLHSQQQALSLLPVLPVGGLRPSPSSPASDVAPSSMSGPLSVGGSAHGPLKTAEEDVGVREGSFRDGGQEENVQTCLRAIASLKINTEDPH